MFCWRRSTSPGPQHPGSPVSGENVSTQVSSGFYWYGGRRRGPGRPPRWVSEVLNALPDHAVTGDSGELASGASLDSGDPSSQTADDWAEEVQVPDGDLRARAILPDSLTDTG